MTFEQAKQRSDYKFHCKLVDYYLQEIRNGKVNIPGNYAWGIAGIQFNGWMNELNFTPMDYEDPLPEEERERDDTVCLDYFWLCEDENYSGWRSIGYAEPDEYPVEVDWTREDWPEQLERDMFEKLQKFIEKEGCRYDDQTIH